MKYMITNSWNNNAKDYYNKLKEYNLEIRNTVVIYGDEVAEVFCDTIISEPEDQKERSFIDIDSLEELHKLTNSIDNIILGETREINGVCYNEIEIYDAYRE